MKEIPKDILQKFDNEAAKECDTFKEEEKYTDGAIFGYQLATESSPDSQSLIDRVKEFEADGNELLHNSMAHVTQSYNEKLILQQTISELEKEVDHVNNVLFHKIQECNINEREIEALKKENKTLKWENDKLIKMVRNNL